MSQQAVAAGGTLLVALAFGTGRRRDTITHGLLSAGKDGHGPTPAQTAAAKRELLNAAGAMLFVGGAVLLAGQSGAWDSAMLAVIGGLLLLFIVNRYGKAPQ